MNDFTVAIVSESTRKRLAGIKVETDMSRAQSDCPALWAEFFPRMREIAGQAATSYGLSWISEGESEGAGCRFTYWAAAELPEDGAMPEGLDETFIPAGLYAGCAVPNLKALPQAYEYFYSIWLPGQNAYSLDGKGPSIESYAPDWETNGFSLYFPVLRAL